MSRNTLAFRREYPGLPSGGHYAAMILVAKGENGSGFLEYVTHADRPAGVGDGGTFGAAEQVGHAQIVAQAQQIVLGVDQVGAEVETRVEFVDAFVEERIVGGCRFDGVAHFRRDKRLQVNILGARDHHVELEQHGHGDVVYGHHIVNVGAGPFLSVEEFRLDEERGIRFELDKASDMQSQSAAGVDTAVGAELQFGNVEAGPQSKIQLGLRRAREHKQHSQNYQCFFHGFLPERVWELQEFPNID